GGLDRMPQTAKTYSARLYDAIELAAKAHHRQVRKGTEIPYIVHPLAVAGLLIRSQCPEHLVIAGLLHDLLEDTPVTVEEIESHFGQRVSELVKAMSEPDKKAPWEKRKAHTIEYLGDRASDEVLLVALADKLDNIRAIREGLESDGEMFWERFNRPREKQKWYYESLEAVLTARVHREPALTLLSAFKVEVNKVFETKEGTL
ncbi:MAG: HD domain-containing protein, partial [Hyphomicrobiales bacterium]